MTDAMGLDFGTTNSALAILRNGMVETIDVSNADIGERTLRSVLFFDDDRTVTVGQDAVARYMAQGGTYGRFLQSIKAFLPQRSFTHTSIFGKRYQIEDLAALLIRGVKEAGESRSGRSFDRVVLGRPAVFSEKPEDDALAQQRLEEAARRAGFKDISFEFEPIAATLSYLDRQNSDADRIVLMGDFGGGTSDFTVMRLGTPIQSQEEKRKRILAVGGVYVGGDTFTARIMWEKVTPYFGKHVTYAGMSGQRLPMPTHLMRTLCKWHLIPFLRDPATLRSIRDIKKTSDSVDPLDNLEKLILGNKGFAVFAALERCKKELSERADATFAFRDDEIAFTGSVSRAEFNRFIAEDIETIRTSLLATLNRAGVGAGSVDQVLLTGGSSFIPAIRELFESEFGAGKVIYLDAFTSVAQGLAQVARLR